MAIRVANWKYLRNRLPKGTIVYIGRPHPEFDYQRSPLANEWSHLKNSRAKYHVEKIEDAITCYHKWLLEEVKDTASAAFLELERLAEIAEQGELVLICWCVGPTGEGQCHGHCVKRAVEWRMRERRKATAPPPDDSSPDPSGNSGHNYNVPPSLLAAASKQSRRTAVIRN